MKRAVQIACAVLGLSGAGACAGTAIYPANPTVVHDAVYVSSQGVTRFHAKTLKRVWRALAKVETLEPVVTQESILVASTQGLYALNPVTGNELWHVAADKTLFPPAVSRGRAFVGGRDGSLRAVELNSGHVIWRKNFGGWLYAPAVVDRLLVVGGNESILRGIEAETGEQLWEKALDQELVYRPVALPDGNVVVTLFNGKILMVNPEDGSIRWQVKDQTPSFPPAFFGNHLYFGTFDGSLKARSRRDGHIIWEKHMNGRLRFLPHVIDGVVLVASDQAELAAYDANTGERLWHQSHPHELIASPVVLNNSVISFTSNARPLSWDASFLLDSRP